MKATGKKTLFLDGSSLTTLGIARVVDDYEVKVFISEETKEKIVASHELLKKFIDDNRVIYGVNTGLGGFVNWLVPLCNAQELQENLISSVATNVGLCFEDRIVRASMLVRLNSLARGTSAISIENFNKLLQIYNAGIVPLVPSKGSLGASGDLGPLGAIALVAIGKGKAKYHGTVVSGKLALKSAGIEPIKLSFKEGLSLINGTSVMTALGALLIEQVIVLVKSYDIISCLSFEGLMAKKQPFNPIVHRQKPHRGQLQTAENIWTLLRDSKMIVDERRVEEQLQLHLNQSEPFFSPIAIEDAYSIRCTPQILGPIRDALLVIKNVITNEINSSNDNPLVLPDQKDVFHNGHFHGQYISMAMDQLSVCLTTLSNLSDRRIDRFMDKNHSNQLPPFLCKESPGLRLGLMGGQFMATSLTAENRSLCHPVSIQSLTSTGDFQDHVSMGLVAARRAEEIYHNTAYILAFELLCGAQSADIRNPKLLSSATSQVYNLVRKEVPYLSSDVSLTEYLEILAKLIKSGALVKLVEPLSGEIYI
ncbi:MAG: phenylalanine aminomutase (D-beta-phenylalanine forming) [Chlamydiae bacterium RIFCSPHIGHO2_12_FULL_44_59]|nr:MAG: phenylalanine aminomutase (D-beta-phenylalanine forming) [Chlamydiae bacterium RIFCSPHIGHO2_01_FULL_44_39]OGN59207.1 MAG: phenylalanine aminomutase (D-beta-phenylalanine forming) [Chlamydiae bacterium RIFCSPHIGHO2_02_FULL_45_9]OGN59450.1 MAG: phenylalanine aminomutase (D-beta-phenylalanine forming) [Chlamydiae bacterium RIFCSPHIGHO2_12_FULL_44_59]OGN67203.1 MAG: phenylalanine aminomutase (D-beta-phenylalanine forming) [Chlamydiae bacterium RIFCSPLOWO2_01_FULL_44_52]OGN67400.1 MAG: pheny